MNYEQKWGDFVYIQRDVEDKESFANNWDRIFGKKNKEADNANNENNDARPKQEDGL